MSHKTTWREMFNDSPRFTAIESVFKRWCGGLGRVSRDLTALVATRLGNNVSIYPS